MKPLFAKQKNVSMVKIVFKTVLLGVLTLCFASAPLLPVITVDAAFNKQINYQGKLTNSSGVAVANGTYNMEFKLMTVASGGDTTQGSCTTSCEWMETRIGGNKVQVTSGLFSVLLGEVTSLSGVDFNQTLYLSVNIGGSGSPSWDGEMTPRKKLGAVPAAVESERVGGFTPSQLATGSQIPVLTADALVLDGTAAGLTGTGSNTLLLQGGSTGDIRFFSASNKLTNAGVLTIAGSALLGAGQGIDTSAAGGLTFGNTNATSISLCNSAACDTISIGTNTDADAINFGDSLDTITITGASGSSFVLNGVTVTAGEFNVLDGGIDESEVTGDIEAVTAGTGLTGGGTDGSVTLDIVSGNGAIVVGANDITLTLTPSGGTGATSSNSGIEILAGGLTLLKGCANGEILKWDDVTDIAWECAADSTGGTVNSFATIDTPSGTDPTADAATDTLQLVVTGTNLTITGANDPEIITFDIAESVLAGAGLAANSSALDINTGNGIQITSDAIALGDLTADWNQSGAFDISLNNASSELKILESAGGAFFGIFDVGDLSTADKTYTFPNTTGTVCISGGTCVASAVAWNAISNPTADQALTFDAGEETTWTIDATTATNFAMNADSLTSGTILSLTSSSAAATTGQKGLNVALTGALTGAQTTYGGYFSNTRTGASAVNVGLYATASGATGANYAAIFDAGNVGIGTATPGAKLDVRAANAVVALGNIAIPTTTDVNHLFIGAGVFNSQEVAGGEVNFGNNWYYNSGYKYRLTDEASNIQLANGIVKFQTAVSGSANGAITWVDNMTMLANGDVDFLGGARIGNAATKSLSVGVANPTTTDVFHIFAGGNGVFIGQNTAAGEVDFGNNFYYNSGWKYRFTQAASRIGMGDDVTGDINFLTAVSGTAGNAITWSNRMKIQNSTGNVGIGGDATPDALFSVGSTSQFQVSSTGGAVTIAGVGDGTDALTLTVGDILVSNGDFDLSGGDFNITLDGTDDASITKTATGTAAEEGLEIFFNSVTGADVDQRALVLDVDSADHSASTDVVVGLDIENLTGADPQGTETAIRIGTGWDNIWTSASTSLTAAGALTVASCTGCTAITANSLDFVDFQDTLDVDAATDINLSTFAFTIDMDSSGDFSIRDGTTNIASFDDSGGITFQPNGSSDLTLTLDDNSQLIGNANITNTGSLTDLNLTLGDDSSTDVVSALNIDVTSMTPAGGDFDDELYAIDIGNLASADANVEERAIRIGSGWDTAIMSAGNYIQSAGRMSLTSANTTQTTTSSIFALNANSLTTGTGLYLASSSISSGKVVDIQVNSTAASSTGQTGLNILLTGANGTASQTTYGLRVSNTHTGTSPINWSAYFDERVNVGAANQDANHALIVRSVNDTANHGLKITANNQTASMEIGYQTISTTGGMRLSVGTTTGLQVAGVGAFMYVGGSVTPTARVHIAAGTTSASTAPLKFTSGTNMTTPEAGAMEWNGTNLFITQTSGPTRKTLAYTSDLGITVGTTTITSGANTLVPFNDSGVYQEDAQFSYNKTTDVLTVSGVDFGTYGGAKGVSTALATDLYFVTAAGQSIFFNSGTQGMSITPNSGVTTGMNVIYGGNTGYLKMGSNFSIYPSTGELRLGANNTENYLTITTGGNVGVGDATPASLFTVGNGDLFQINSTGQIGAQVAPTSDYLFSLAGTTGNDHSRVLNIIQANNASENSYGIVIDSTQSLGTLSTTRAIFGISNTLTPTATIANGGELSTLGSYNLIDSSSITVTETEASLTMISVNGIITGTPTINQTPSDQFSWNQSAVRGVASITPVLTSVENTAINSYGGQFFETSDLGAGEASFNFNSYGVYGYAGGNLTTNGTTNHYGGNFTAAGTADTNYGIYATASGATANYAGIFAAGNVGIGDTTPASLLTVGSGDLFQVNTFGDIFGSQTTLDGSTTSNGAGTTSTTLIVNSNTNFNVGNYVKVDPTGANVCSGAVTVCYAKITAIGGTNFTISPALTWDNGASVVEVHVPEIGGIDLSEPLANRYGRGYFIDGIVTGNGTTRFTDNSIVSGSNFSIISNSGLVGINTTTFTANATLEVAGTIGAVADANNNILLKPSGDGWNNITSISTNVDWMIGETEEKQNQFNIWTNEGYPIVFGTNDEERMRIEDDGVTIANGFLCVGAGNCAGGYDAGSIHANDTTVYNVDLAEKYPSKDTTLVPGEVVMIDEDYADYIKRSNPGEGKNVIGVISTKPGLTLGGGNTQYEPDKIYPVALSGRVPVKVTNENGEIKSGDFLTASATRAGYAMKATKAGAVVGQALEGFTGTEGTISTFIKATEFNGGTIEGDNQVVSTSRQLLLSSLGQLGELENSVNLSQVFTDRVVAGLEIITPTLIAGNVATNTISATSGADVGIVLDASGRFVIGGGTTTNADGTTSVANATVTIDSLGNATFAGKITANEIEAGSIKGLDVITDRLTVLGEGQEALSLTASAVSALGTALGAANEYLMALSSAQEGIDARLVLIEQLFDAETAALVIGEVNTEKLSVTGESTFGGESQFDGLSFFNNETRFDGSVVFGSTVGFTLPPLFNKDTAGFALVKEGDRRVEIVYENEYAAAPVINTTIVFSEEDEIDDDIAGAFFDAGLQTIVVGNTSTGFTILLNKPAPRDIRFSWTALAVDDPHLFESLIEGLDIVPPPDPEPESEQNPEEQPPDETPPPIDNDLPPGDEEEPPTEEESPDESPEPEGQLEETPPPSDEGGETGQEQ